MADESSGPTDHVTSATPVRKPPNDITQQVSSSH